MSDNKTLNISGIREGYVLDHIQDGRSMMIYDYLHLEDLKDCTIAMIMHAKSNKMGSKDIMKIECPLGSIDIEILGFIDHNITVNVIKDEKIIDKVQLALPKTIKNVITCKNPRCITSIEQELEQVFYLSDKDREIYRCKYCDEKYRY